MPMKTVVSLGIVAFTGAMVAIAQVLEHAFDFAPCALCLMQRIWFMTAGLIALTALAHNPRLGIYPLLTLVAAISGAGFSIRQLWLQSLPPEEVPSCGPGFEYMIEAFPLSDVLRAMVLGTGNCAEVVWTFLGLSIPGWALVGFVAVAAGAVVQWRSA